MLELKWFNYLQSYEKVNYIGKINKTTIPRIFEFGRSSLNNVIHNENNI